MHTPRKPRIFSTKITSLSLKWLLILAFFKSNSIIWKGVQKLNELNFPKEQWNVAIFSAMVKLLEHNCHHKVSYSFIFYMYPVCSMAFLLFTGGKALLWDYFALLMLPTIMYSGHYRRVCWAKKIQGLKGIIFESSDLKCDIFKTSNTCTINIKALVRRFFKFTDLGTKNWSFQLHDRRCKKVLFKQLSFLLVLL